MGNTMKTPRTTPAAHTAWQSGLRSDFLAVLYDYPTPDISQPIFQVGEKLRVISDEGGWWRAQSLTTGQENYIPETCVAKVYHGWLFEGLGREKAEELLQLPNTRIGSFMIRKSETTKGLYSLSVKHVQVKHYRIFRLPNNWYYISPRQTFQCLEDLVNHYSEVADGLCCMLTSPCLTQHTISQEVRNQEPPVVMRNKNFTWKDKQRSMENDDEIADILGMEDSGLSFGLRDSITSYLALTGGTDSSYVSNKKKSQSVIYRSKYKPQNPLIYNED
ncbi:src-like-adapter [Hemicordylus capensis]|uniref:src-like-adapter n=1 Tax=Hemicordylus capensis TaxID=884348 RepID=UPI0023034A25|nr:src-like-adapter [Hemicordylus capensis]XP_053106705.1 src-like-adapter [Hemicordylus capensis]XP_053106706.1 src-like-adapter [Hemicordylus capensis]